MPRNTRSHDELLQLQQEAVNAASALREAMGALFIACEFADRTPFNSQQKVEYRWEFITSLMVDFLGDVYDDIENSRTTKLERLQAAAQDRMQSAAHGVLA